MRVMICASNFARQDKEELSMADHETDREKSSPQGLDGATEVDAGQAWCAQDILLYPC